MTRCLKMCPIAVHPVPASFALVVEGVIWRRIQLQPCQAALFYIRNRRCGFGIEIRGKGMYNFREDCLYLERRSFQRRNALMSSIQRHQLSRMSIIYKFPRCNSIKSSMRHYCTIIFSLKSVDLLVQTTPTI